MKKRLLIPFIVAAAAIGAGFWLLRLEEPADHLLYYAAQLEDQIHAHSLKVDTLLTNPGFLADLRAGRYDTQSSADPAFFLYQDQSLVYYTSALLPAPVLSAIGEDGGSYEIEGDFYHFLRKKTGAFTLVSVLPIFRTPAAEQPGTNGYFPLAEDFPRALGWQNTSSNAPVRGLNSEILGYLFAQGAIASPTAQAIFSLLFLLAITGLITGGIGLTFQLSERLSFWSEVLIILVHVILLRFIFWELHSSFPVQQLAALTQPVGRFRIADLLLLDLLLFWIAWLGYRRKIRPFLPGKHPFFSAAAYYLMATLPLIFMAALIRYITLYAQTSLDFSNLFYLSPAGFLAVGSALLTAIPFYLFSQWLVLKTRTLELNANSRLLSASSGLLLIALSAPGLDLPLIPALLAGIIFIALLDLFADYRRQSLTWLIIWLVFFSAFTSVMFFKYYIDRSVQQMEEIAQSIIEVSDPLTESQLSELADTLAAAVISADSTALPVQVLEDHLYRAWSRHDHLGLRYQFSIPESNSIKGRSPDQPPYARRISDKLLFLASGTYRLFIPTGRPQNEQVLVEVQPHSRHRLTVSHQLTRPEQSTADLDYAVYLNDRVVRRRGNPAEEWTRTVAPPPPGQFKYRLSSARADLFYSESQTERVLIGQSMGGYARPLALFSFLFVLLLAAVLLLTAVLMAPRGRWPFSRKTSLRYRLQLAFIALIIGAFVLIGIVTAGSFRRSFRDQYSERLSNTIEAIVKDFRREFDTGGPGLDGMRRHRLAQQLSETHQADIGLYYPDGTLAASSDPYLYRHGLLPQRVPQAALRSKERGRSGLYVWNATTELLDYRTAFVPIEGRSSSAALFIGIPYLSQEGVRPQDLYALIGTLINVYVFVLLAASSIAIVVANSITQPLDRIGEKLQQLRLGRNEPLEWNSDDEIGQLVAAYNDMIAKLEKRTEALRRSEREGAWREMAKQVAHEIKTPLTPMKLSIQHLERAIKLDPDNSTGLMQRVSHTLVEQIESLSRIATEFSSFAKMPAARSETFSLNDLLHSTFTLYENNPEHEATLQLQLPAQPLTIQADKSQMRRVFNNLLKNALQAIPPDKKGQIELVLFQRGQKAIVEVRDNGSGIPKEMEPKVFYPNFTTKSSGMGLGLAMCKNIIEQASGRIYFETTEAKGTTFFVEVPLAEGAANGSSK